MLCMISMPLYIRWLKTRQIGQFIREEGPASHAAKASTPTMGGVAFIAATLIVCLVIFALGSFWSKRELVVIAVATVCGLLGLADDMAKLKRKANAGLSARTRLVLEIGLGVAAGALLLLPGGLVWMFLPQFSFGGFLVHGPIIEMPPVLYLLLAGFLLAATTNAVNLHDGMDGLAAGTAVQVLLAMAIILTATSQLPLAVVAAVAAGAVGGFLIFNRYPASVFMGDTGSLYLGGLIALLALAGGIVVWFVPLTLIYIAETLSVMAQVTYFKLTKPYTPEKPMPLPLLIWFKLTRRLPGEGKRLFRMAPLHHHFEAVAADAGIAEWKVVACFWLVQFVICLLVLISFKF